MEEAGKGESWNKKRIIIAVIAVILLIVGGAFLKANFFAGSSRQSQSVKGANAEEVKTESIPKIDIQGAVKEKMNNLKEQVSSLSIAEIESSSPQVQKIINDIKSLEQYPTNQIKEICRKICGL
jgi:hypothetical protein